MHRYVITRYMDSGSQLADVPDDGYFMHNVTFHLFEAEMTDELKQLIRDPFWLEEKLHSYGVASTVVDFRRCIMGSSDPDIRLFLQVKAPVIPPLLPVSILTSDAARGLPWWAAPGFLRVFGTFLAFSSLEPVVHTCHIGAFHPTRSSCTSASPFTCLPSALSSARSL